MWGLSLDEQASLTLLAFTRILLPSSWFGSGAQLGKLQEVMRLKSFAGEGNSLQSPGQYDSSLKYARFHGFPLSTGIRVPSSLQSHSYCLYLIKDISTEAGEGADVFRLRLPQRE